MCKLKLYKKDTYMKIVYTVEALQEARESLKQSVGFVPTMGALHAGHLSLIQKSVNENSHTIVSIFVNPTQFLEGEDLSKYPRREEKDLDICKRAGVDIVFMPKDKTMYFEDEPLIKAPPKKGYILEGACRAGHFDGVLRVVLKLFNLTNPTNAYFGKKDAQQLYLIQNMVRSFFMPTTIVPCEIVRENDGLALSSRNIYLSEKEREEALKLSLSLKKVSELILQKQFNSQELKAKMLEILYPLRIDYVEIINREFEPLEEVELKNSIVLVAAYVGTTRLIDNMWI